MGGDLIADRLFSALGRPNDVAADQLAALGSESRGLLELGLTTVHAWQRVAESRGRGRGAADVVVLFTDLVGFSSWALESGDELAITLLREVSEAIEPAIVERGGKVVKRLGDGLMAVFRDASSATEAAFDARERAAPIDVGGSGPSFGPASIGPPAQDRGRLPRRRRQHRCAPAGSGQAGGGPRLRPHPAGARRGRGDGDETTLQRHGRTEGPDRTRRGSGRIGYEHPTRPPNSHRANFRITTAERCAQVTGVDPCRRGGVARH